jgi:hypothetical protein
VLYGKSLRICYRLLADGVVTRQLVGIDDPSGTPIAAPRRTFPGLDWSEQQERGGVAGKGRPVVLQFDQDEAEAALMTWLEAVGLYVPGDA